ncbi:hypothetical protein D3C73_771540 [compost metagenome]
MGLDHLNEAQALHFTARGRLAVFFLHLLEDFGFVDVPADIDRDGNNHQAKRERQAPGPVRNLLLREELGDQRAAGRADQQGQHLAGHLPRPVEAALAVGRHFNQQRRGRAEFPARRKALQQARDQDKDGGQDAGCVVGGGHRDQRDGYGHQRRHHHHGRFTALLVAVQAQDDAAHRAHEKADAEDGRRHQDGIELAAGQVGVGGEKELRDDRRHEREHQEVIPFEGVAYDCGHDVACGDCFVLHGFSLGGWLQSGRHSRRLTREQCQAPSETWALPGFTLLFFPKREVT